MDDLIAERIEFLRSIRLFSKLTDRMLEAIATRCKQRFAGPKQVIYRRGEQCLGLYIIQSGEVRMFNVTPQGREKTANIMKAGSVPGVFSFLKRTEHSNFATTITDTRWLFLSTTAMAQARRPTPEMGQLMTIGLMEEFDEQAMFPNGPPPLDHISARLGNVLLTYIDRARIARTIPDDANVFDIDIGPPRSLMRRVGSPTRFLLPALQTLHSKGLIDILLDGRIRILDLAQLQKDVYASHHTLL